MIKYAVLLVLLAVANAEPTWNENVIQMDTESLEFYNLYFRQALMGIIKTEMKNAIDLSNILSDLNEQCQSNMLSQTQQCNSCTQDVCSISNIDEEYIEVLDATISVVKMLEDITNKLADAVELLGDNAPAFLNDIRDLRDYASDNEHEEIWMALEELDEKIDEVVNNIASGVDNVIDNVGGIQNDLADSLEDSEDYLENSLNRLRDKYGDGFHDMFGFDKRKKRYIDGETRQCMEECDLCYPLLIETNTGIITGVCGSGIIEQNRTLTSQTEKIRNVYGAAVDRDNPVVSEIFYEMLSKNSRMQQTHIVITARLYGGGTILYETEVPYLITNVPNIAVELAIEYWDRAH